MFIAGAKVLSLSEICSNYKIINSAHIPQFLCENVLYHCCTKAKDQFEPFRREINTSVFSEHGRGVASHTPLQKWKEAQIRVPGPIPGLYTIFCEIWEHFTQHHLAS